MGQKLSQRMRMWCRKSGIDVARFPARGSLGHAIQHCRIDTVLDVGANIGQTGVLLRGMNFKGNIISFEPLSEAYKILEARSAKDPRWSCHPCGLGAVDEKKEIHIAASSVYSSFLATSANAEAMDQGSRQERIETVHVRQLSKLWKELNLDGKNILLKIDTQGYEKNVLEGAAEVLPQIAAMHLELSIHPFYMGQPTFVEMIEYVRSLGYLIGGFEPGWNDEKTGELLEFDGIFIRAQ